MSRFEHAGVNRNHSTVLGLLRKAIFCCTQFFPHPTSSYLSSGIEPPLHLLLTLPAQALLIPILSCGMIMSSFYIDRQNGAPLILRRSQGGLCAGSESTAYEYVFWLQQVMNLSSERCHQLRHSLAACWLIDRCCGQCKVSLSQTLISEVPHLEPGLAWTMTRHPEHKGKSRSTQLLV